MPTIIKKIKDFITGDTIYPLTKATAVYMNNDTTTVESAIGALNDKTTLKANSYVINGVTFVFRRYGRIAVVTSSGAATNAIPTNAYMGSVTVADVYKPLASEIQYVNATGVASIQFNLGTSGVFQVGYASIQISSGANVRMATSYITAN